MWSIFKPQGVLFFIGKKYRCRYHTGDGQWKEAIATVLDTAPYGVYFDVPGLTGLSTYPFTPKDYVEYGGKRYKFAFLDRWCGFSCSSKDIIDLDQE